MGTMGYTEFNVGENVEALKLSVPTHHLVVELVPKSMWGFNLRSELTKAQWDKIRKAVYERAGHRCEICGGKGSKHPVEAHERWVYDDTTHVQKLVGVEALCPMCHKVRHLGRTIAVGQGDMAMGHLDRVNGWTPKQTEDHVVEAMKVWAERSKHTWTLDLTWVRNGSV